MGRDLAVAADPVRQRRTDRGGSSGDFLPLIGYRPGVERLSRSNADSVQIQCRAYDIAGTLLFIVISELLDA